jgi:hypothetical protein
VTWSRTVAAAALADVLAAATTATVHDSPPEVINPPCVIVGRPDQVSYANVGMGIDEATVPVIFAGGVETEDALDDLKTTCRKAVDADPTLGGQALSAVATGERNWRNLTGAGGIQLILCEMVVTVRM